MKIKTFIKKGFLYVLTAGFLLAGNALSIRADARVALTSEVFKDKKLLEAVKNYDRNQDGYLDSDEIAMVSSINMSESITDAAGLEYLTNLDSVKFAYKGTVLKLGKSVKAIQLELNTASIRIDAPGAESLNIGSYYGEGMPKSCKTVDVSKCANLKDVFLSASGMTSMKFPANGGNIETLKILNSDMKTMTLPTAKKLTDLTISLNGKLTTLDLKNVPNLQELHIDNNENLKTLKLDKNKQLKGLTCWNTSITKLDLSKNTNLTSLSCPKNKLTSLDCSKNTKLTALQCYENKLTSLNVKKASKLEEVSCSDNAMKSLDLSNNKKLKTVFCNGNPLKSLYVKDKANILKKVSVAPALVSAKAKRGSDGGSVVTVNLKKNNKIKAYYVIIKSTEYGISEEKQESGPTVVFDGIGYGKHDIQVLSGVDYRGTTVFFKEALYKNKLTVKE